MHLRFRTNRDQQRPPGRRSQVASKLEPKQAVSFCSRSLYVKAGLGPASLSALIPVITLGRTGDGSSAGLVAELVSDYVV